ncbi:MAG TPA: hypothetical protein VGG85_08785 [Terracidiphilus sp.]
MLRLWHLASLDAPTVAVVWTYGFAWIAQVKLPAWAPVLLALVAWVVYISDRLLDARAGLRTPPLHLMRERHYFHWRHRKALIPVAIAGTIGGAWLVITRLPAGARVPDSAIAAFTLVYFSGVHARRKLPAFAERMLSPFRSKEFAVGVLFTAGCLLPVRSQIAQSGSSFSTILLPALYFVGLAWLNCVSIERWESAQPGAMVVRRMCAGFAIVGISVAAQQAFTHPRTAAFLAAGVVSALLLAGLDALRTRMTAVTLRAAADFVLLTPAVLLLPSLLHR